MSKVTDVAANWLRRARNSLSWRRRSSAGHTQDHFALDDVLERVQHLQPPSLTSINNITEPAPIHAVIKLAPIPLPRVVRWEGHVTYALAWCGTALLAWGALHVATWQSAQWLLAYGFVSVLVFAALFRLEGPLTRKERHLRLATLEQARESYQNAEVRLECILHERFNERMQDFHALCAAYQELYQGQEAKEFKEVTAEEDQQKINDLEVQLLDVVHELEDFSELHKQEIDDIIVACHDARLAYWQARLDAACFTGEVVAGTHP